MNTNTLHQHIKTLITRIAPPTTTPKIVIGLSGGADSVFLLHHLVLVSKQIPLELIAAHLNHGWRGDADAADEQFCRALAEQLNVPFITEKSQNITIAQRWNGSQEELGRHQRHTFLQTIATTSGAHAIALGHQAQDQEELFFIRLMRGTSLEGLGGMQPHEGNIIRPLLGLQRTDIEQWLSAAGHTWQHDSDNDNRRFLRNRIRHELLPLVHAMEPRFATTFTRTHALLREEQALVEELVTREFDTIFTLVPMSAHPDGSIHFASQNTPAVACGYGGSKNRVRRSSMQSLDHHKRGISRVLHEIPNPISITGNLTAFKQCTPMLQRHLFKRLCHHAGAPFPTSQGIIDEALRFLNNPRGGTHQLWTGWVLNKARDTFCLTSTAKSL